MTKRSRLAVFLYGLIFVSLLATLQLADRVAGGGAAGGQFAVQNTSAFTAMVEDLAQRLPLWAYVVIFISLALGVRMGMGRYYKKIYLSAREKQKFRDTYAPIRDYKALDPAFSNRQFAELAGKLQEQIQICSKSGDFPPVQPFVSSELYERLPGIGKPLGMEMSQLKLDGFRRDGDRDIIAVLMTCAWPRGLRSFEFEWLFERPVEGRGTPSDDGGWRLYSIESMD